MEREEGDEDPEKDEMHWILFRFYVSMANTNVLNVPETV